jgi:hypothetical protein
MKLGNYSNWVHWLYAVRTGTSTSMDFSMFAMASLSFLLWDQGETTQAMCHEGCGGWPRSGWRDAGGRRIRKERLTA